MNRALAHFFSVLGHPIFVVFYGLLLLLAFNPYAFGARSIGDRAANLLIIMVFAYTVLIPGLGILVMKPLGLISNVRMPDKQERIVPYIVTGVFYTWLVKNLISGGQAPQLFTQFVLGATIGLFLVFFFNIFTKISAHAAGMGGLATGAFIAATEWGGQIDLRMFGGVLSVSMNTILIMVLLLAGLVGVSRLALREHTPADLYRGYAAGVASQLAAAWLL